MKALWLEEGRLSLRTDAPEPEPAADEAVVRVLKAGICNTDLELVRGYYPYTGIPGHESVGRVEEGPQELAGQRVVGEIEVVGPRCGPMSRRMAWAAAAVLALAAGAGGQQASTNGAAPDVASPPADVADLGGAAAQGEAGRLGRANAAMKAWIAALDTEEPFLLLDRGEGRLRLHHGGALLRDCRVVADSLGLAPPARQELSRRLRRYRRASPYDEPESGPFDWEQYLAEAATPDGGMYFDSGLLLYAADAWGVPRAPSARLAVGDLRALYDALPQGAVLVVLPAGWRTAAASSPAASTGRRP